MSKLMQKTFDVGNVKLRPIDLMTEFTFGMADKGGELYTEYNRILYGTMKNSEVVQNLVNEKIKSGEVTEDYTGTDIVKLLTVDQLMDLFTTRVTLVNAGFKIQVLALITTEIDVKPSIKNYDNLFDIWETAIFTKELLAEVDILVTAFLDFFMKQITADSTTLSETAVMTETDTKPKPNLKVTKKKA